MEQKSISETLFDKTNIPFYGNKFLIGNGYFGIRGALEEYKKENMPAVNMAGIYDKVGDKWRESVNAPNPLFARIKVDGQDLKLPESEPFSHKQNLDIKTAIHTRKTVWKTEKGQITVFCERFASMANQHLICMKYSVSVDFDCKLEIITGIDGDVWDINGPHFAKISPEIVENAEKVTGITGEKGICVTVEQSVNTAFGTEAFSDEMSVFKRIAVNAKANNEYYFTKIASVITSCDDFENNDDITKLNYTEEKIKHIEKWEQIWDNSYIKIMALKSQL